MQETIAEIIKRKIWRLKATRKCFKEMSFLLESGTYTFKNWHFHLLQPGETVNPLRKVRVNSVEKNPVLYDHGLYVIHKDKCTFVFEDRTYQIETDPAKYSRTRSRIGQYREKLPYRTLAVEFDDDRCMYVSETIKVLYDRLESGIHVESRFEETLSYLFDSLAKAEISVKQMKIKDTEEDLYYCVQHGDCHGGNVVWTENGPLMIDLGFIGEYPLFYDIVYYVHFYNVHQFKMEDAFGLFREDRFTAKVEETCTRLGIPYDPSLFDHYLAAYVYRMIQYLDDRKIISYLDFTMKGFTPEALHGFPEATEALKVYHERLRQHKPGR